MIKRYELLVFSEYGHRERAQERDDGDWVYAEDHEREVKELERRVRWLESVLLDADAYGWEYELQDCANIVSEVISISPNKTGGERKVRPTPEYFE